VVISVLPGECQHVAEPLDGRVNLRCRANQLGIPCPASCAVEQPDERFAVLGMRDQGDLLRQLAEGDCRVADGQHERSAHRLDAGGQAALLYQVRQLRRRTVADRKGAGP
jgi:hypothetical protein